MTKIRDLQRILRRMEEENKRIEFGDGSENRPFDLDKWYEAMFEKRLIHTIAAEGVLNYLHALKCVMDNEEA